MSEKSKELPKLGKPNELPKTLEKLQELPKFEDFLGYSRAFYAIMGMEPYKQNTKKNLFYQLIQIIIFLITVINMNITIIIEFIYLLQAMRSFSTFLEVTALAPCMGFCVLTVFKVAVVWLKRGKIQNFMIIMNDKFPITLNDHQLYRTIDYKKNTLNLEKGYSLLLMILVWSFNLNSIIQSFIEYFIFGWEFIYRYAYFMWYPFEINTNLIYSLVYIQQMHAGQIAAAGTLATDLLLISLAMLCCMHFDYIARQLNELNPNGNEEDVKELNKIIKHHQIILELSADINDIFSLLVLFNFLASTVIICLVGFQASAGVTPLELFKYIQFLIFELIQVWTLCYLGNKLIDSSTDIANATYNQLWFKGNKKYRKSILLLMTRAQKPAIINAKSFAIVSLQTFTKVLSTSYQFFALLRTMYRK